MVQKTSDPKQTACDGTECEWVGFPGGELEGKRPKILCPACRSQPQPRSALCFDCFRAGMDRQHMLKAAGQLDTASVERFQTVLPFEPVNRPRRAMLKAERSTGRAAGLATPAGQFVDRRRRAQIAARHALQRVAQGFGGAGTWKPMLADREREIAAAIHAAELQLPEA